MCFLGFRPVFHAELSQKFVDAIGSRSRFNGCHGRKDGYTLPSSLHPLEIVGFETRAEFIVVVPADAVLGDLGNR